MGKLIEAYELFEFKAAVNELDNAFADVEARIKEEAKSISEKYNVSYDDIYNEIAKAFKKDLITATESYIVNGESEEEPLGIFNGL
jgi:hypothetical protein